MADIRINSLPTTATSAASDDYVALDGAANGTRKILASNIAQNVSDVVLGVNGPSVKSSLDARAARQGLVSDSTNNTISIANTQVFGTGDFTLSIWYNPTLAETTYPIYPAANNGVGFKITNAGAFVIRFSGVGDLTASTATIVANKWQLLTYTRSGTTGTYYVNGVAAGTVTDSNNYSAATNTINANGIVSGLYIYNRALSASEVVSLFEAGVPAGADYNTASNTALNTSSFVNIDFTTLTGASATGFTATNTSGAFKYAKSAGVFSITTGQRIRVRYTLSGTFTNLRMELAEAGVAGKSAYATLSSGTNEATLVATGSTANGVVQFYSNGSSDNFTLSSVTIDRPGLLLAPDAAQAGGGLAWYDTSGNAANITLPASGVSWNVPSSQKTASGWTFGGNLTVNGSGNFTGSSLSLTGSGRVLNIPSAGINWGNDDTPALNANLYRTGAAALRSNSSLTLDGNLTVSGTGNSSVAGKWLVGSTTAPSGGSATILAAASVGGGVQLSNTVANNGGLINAVNGAGLTFYSYTGALGAESYTELARFVSGNLLLGTTTDNGYKLQVNGSTWTNGSSRLANDLYVYGGLASSSGYITSNSGAGGLYFANQGTSTAMRFYTTDSGAAAQLALTLDSSQRTILSGPLRLANAYAAGAPAATGYVTIQDSSGTTYKVLVST